MLRLWRRRRESGNSEGLDKGNSDAAETRNSGQQAAVKDSAVTSRSGSQRSSTSGSRDGPARGSPVNFTRLTRPSKAAARYGSTDRDTMSLTI
eukprot:642295-Rhodomonas_salina.1